MNSLLTPLFVSFLLCFIKSASAGFLTNATRILRQQTVQGIPGIPVPNGAYPAHIFFAADDESKLYVNGVLKASLTSWADFASVMADLKHGDVVALEIKDHMVWYGAIVALHYQGQLHVTGREDWRAIKKFTSSNIWKLPTYSACSWPVASVLPNVGSYNRGKSPYFPYYTKARYVWAQNAGRRDTIFLRYRIGGEKCRSLITYAADNTIRVYVNGQQVGPYGTNWARYYKAAASLSTGDVIAVHATDFGVWYGAFVAIQMGATKIRTGVEEWKAIKAFPSSTWNTQGHSSCKWAQAVVLPNANSWNGGKATPFPNTAFPTAKYVWAKGVRGSSIYMRHVVGGENCNL